MGFSRGSTDVACTFPLRLGSMIHCGFLPSVPRWCAGAPVGWGTARQPTSATPAQGRSTGQPLGWEGYPFIWMAVHLLWQVIRCGRIPGQKGHGLADEDLHAIDSTAMT